LVRECQKAGEREEESGVKRRGWEEVDIVVIALYRRERWKKGGREVRSWRTSSQSAVRA